MSVMLRFVMMQLQKSVIGTSPHRYCHFLQYWMKAASGIPISG